jgi:hypothetical protein
MAIAMSGCLIAAHAAKHGGDGITGMVTRHGDHTIRKRDHLSLNVGSILNKLLPMASFAKLLDLSMEKLHGF